MQTTQIIEASAVITTITELKAGDVYKRVVSDTAESRLVFGVVQDVMHNGDDGAISTLEVVVSYQSVLVQNKVFDTQRSVALYAATPVEFDVHLAEMRKAAEANLRAAEHALTKAQEAVELIGSYQDSARSLTAPVTVTTTLSALREARALQNTMEA